MHLPVTTAIAASSVLSGARYDTSSYKTSDALSTYAPVLVMRQDASASRPQTTMASTVRTTSVVSITSQSLSSTMVSVSDTKTVASSLLPSAPTTTATSHLGTSSVATETITSHSGTSSAPMTTATSHAGTSSAATSTPPTSTPATSAPATSTPATSTSIKSVSTTSTAATYTVANSTAAASATHSAEPTSGSTPWATKGKIAGIVVGSVLGLVFLGLLGYALFAASRGINVTHTVIVTPTVTVGVKSPPVGASTTEYERGTSFSMSQPLATTAITDNFPLSTTAPNQEDTASGSSNLGPMIGGTVAVVGGIMLIFLLYKYCKRSKAKSSDVELGQLPSTRSRERQGVSRSVPMSHNYGVNPIAVANAMNWQDSKGVQHEARDTARGAGKASTLDIRQSDLAQAQGWDRPFDADGFQVSRTYGGSSTGPSSRVRLPKHVPPRKPVPAAHPVGVAAELTDRATIWLGILVTKRQYFVITILYSEQNETRIGSGVDWIRAQNAEPQNAEDRKIGPIPLPLFIAICIFGPSMVSFFCWFIYQNTVKRAQNKKLRAEREQERIAEEKLMETHINHFLTNEVPAGRR
ncbi:Hamartin domain-containing protein [Pyrenophora tritici-repentis]|nr:Hamartin domain-containing protein [Pyrenophora tritici-repentis]